MWTPDGLEIAYPIKILNISEILDVVKKQKKEGPIKRLVHKIMFFAVFVTGLFFVLQFINAGLRFQYWLVYLGYFVVHALNGWKGSKQNQVVHYKDEVHQVIPPQEYDYTGKWDAEEKESSRWSFFG